MAGFNNFIQKMIALHGVRKEIGSGVEIASVSGQTFTVATKLRKVISGKGVMDTDGMTAKADTGIVSNGQVTFRRFAPIETSADTITYELHGF
jgi:hypothetical protein